MNFARELLHIPQASCPAGPVTSYLFLHDSKNIYHKYEEAIDPIANIEINPAPLVAFQFLLQKANIWNSIRSGG